MAIVGDATIVVRANTALAQTQISNAVRDMSRNIRSGFSGLQLGMLTAGKEADDFYIKFNKLIERSYYLQAALAGIVPAIGAVVGGLFAFGAQIASALPALIVLPSALVAVGQAAVTAKLAFSGLGAAIKELTKAKSAGGAASVDRMPALLSAMANAQEQVVRASKNLEKAQEGVNEAFKVAAERIQQLNFDVEGAALSEKKAALALEDARRELALVQDLPPDSRMRQEAELAFQEADLNYRRAKDRASDLVEEQKEVTKNGTRSMQEQIENSDEYLRAKEQEVEAVIALKKAIDEQLRAQKALESGGGGSGGAEASTEAFDKLTESAKKFALYIVSLQPKLQELKDVAADGLFPKLQPALETLVDKLFPSFKKIVGDTASALGDAAQDFANIATSAEGLEKLNIVGATNVDTVSKLGKVAGNLYDVFMSLLAAADPLIRRFTDWLVTLTDTWKETFETKRQTGELTDFFNKAGDAAAQLGDILGNLWDALMILGGAASGPGSGGQMLMDSFEGATGKFKEFLEEASESGKLQDYFRDVAENFKTFARIVQKVLGGILKSGASEGATGFLESLEKAVDTLSPAFKKLTESNLIGGFVEQMARFIAAVTESQSIQVFFGIITKALGLLSSILENPFINRIFLFAGAWHAVRIASSVLGRAFGGVSKYFRADVFRMVNAAKTVGGMSHAFNTLRQNGVGVKDSFKIAGKGAKAFRDEFKRLSSDKNNNLSTVVRGANKVAASYVTMAGSAVTGSTITIGANSATTASFLPLTTAAGAVVAPFLLIVAVAALIVGVFIMMYKKSEIFRKSLKDLVDKVMTAFAKAWDAIKGTLDEVLSQFGGLAGFVGKLGNVFKFLGDIIGKYVIPVIGVILENAIKVAQNIIQALIYGIGVLISAFAFVWNIVTAIISLFRGDFKGAGKAVGKAIESLKNIFRFAFKAIGKIIGSVLDIFKKVFKPSTIINIFKGLGKLLFNIWKGIIGFVIKAVKWYLGVVIDFWKKLPGRILDALKALGGLLWDVWSKIMGFVIEAVKWYLGQVIDFWKKLPGRIIGAITGLGKLLWDALSAAFRLAVDAAKWYIGLIIGFWKKLPGRILRALGALGGLIKDIFSKAFGFAVNIGKNAIGAIVDAVTGLPGRLLNLLGSIGSAAIELGKAILQGFIDGLKTLGSAALGLAEAIGDAILGALKAAWTGFIDILNKATPDKLGWGVLSIDLPDNPWDFLKFGLAEGGIVPATPGGLPALIGEGGRPERVEPLDPDGLSKRDKAMIKLLVGQSSNGEGGGSTINVYPSKGMSEMELAAAVARNSTRMFRKGGF